MKPDTVQEYDPDTMQVDYMPGMIPNPLPLPPKKKHVEMSYDRDFDDEELNVIPDNFGFRSDNDPDFDDFRGIEEYPDDEGLDDYDDGNGFEDGDFSLDPDGFDPGPGFDDFDADPGSGYDDDFDADPGLDDMDEGDFDDFDDNAGFDEFDYDDPLT